MARERRVLLVEDDAPTAALYLEQLRKDAVPIEHVDAGGDADRFMRDRHPVLVLVDVGLRDGTARDLIETWSSDPHLSGTPVWIVSEADAIDDVWWHEAPNVQRFFLKSRVSPARLSIEIRATLGMPYGDRLQNRQLAS